MLFSDLWLKRLLMHWNKNQELISLLKLENFSAVIGYGLADDKYPLFVLVINGGRLDKIVRYRNQALDWDLRATSDNWMLLIKSPPGIAQLGLAYSQKRLICRKGNYSTMIKNSNLSKAFCYSFKIMHLAEMA